MKEHDIPVNQININGNAEAREQVKKINNGYASVPTLVFPDGSILTEPSLREIRLKLGMEETSLSQKLSRIFGK